MKLPTTLAAFRRWLAALFDELDRLSQHECDYFQGLQIAVEVDQAQRLACRFGAGHLLTRSSSIMTPLQALECVGRLLAWAERPEHPDLMSVKEVAAKIGTSVRTVWRMVSSGELVQPVKIGGLSRWRRSDIQAMMDLLESNKR
jgi:excisionase family DNA binding protein